MLIEWHIVDGKAVWYTAHKPCCEHWLSDADFGFYVNYRPDGLYLEVPRFLEADLLNMEGEGKLDDYTTLKVQWVCLGKLEWCPFCGARISMMKTNREKMK